MATIYHTGLVLNSQAITNNQTVSRSHYTTSLASVAMLYSICKRTNYKSQGAWHHLKREMVKTAGETNSQSRTPSLFAAPSCSWAQWSVICRADPGRPLHPRHCTSIHIKSSQATGSLPAQPFKNTYTTHTPAPMPGCGQKPGSREASDDRRHLVMFWKGISYTALCTAKHHFSGFAHRDVCGV